MFHVKHLRDFAYARRKLLEHLCELHVSAGHGSGFAYEVRLPARLLSLHITSNNLTCT